MRKFVLALIAVLPTMVSAQTPTPTPVPWNVAEITVTAPTTYADGSTLADTSVLTYQLETVDPGKTDWRVATTFKTLVYRHSGLSVGVHQYRVRVITPDGLISEASNAMSKTAVAPAASPAKITIR